MKNFKHIFLVTITALSWTPEVQSQQTKVTLNPTIQKYLGKDRVSNLDRSIYFNMHSGTSKGDKDITNFVERYDVGFGRIFWAPFSYSFSKTKEVGKYPSFTPDKETGLRPVERMVATEHPNLNVIKFGEVDPVLAGKWASDYYGNKSLSGDVIPEFFEPLNEPFVHATDQIFKPATGDQMKTLMVDFYKEIGKQIDQNPRLANMKVVGYASAYPSMELKDFEHWEDNMKRFIDGAADYMDGISVHLYDGINIRGKQSRRSGSNSEAILDLIDTYTAMRYGQPKPLAITEYGGIDDTETASYSEIINSRTVGSINHLLMNLLDRQDNMLISIPFLVDKAKWNLNESTNYTPYGPVLFLPDDPRNPNTTTWKLSIKAKFYELWDKVAGVRFDVYSDNPDVQVCGFRDGNKIYLALDNLDDSPQTVDLLTSIDWKQYSNIKLRSLIADYDNGLSYDVRSFDPLQEKIVLQKQNTVILEADIQNPISDNKLVRERYFAPDYLSTIKAGQPISFNFNGVKAGPGRAIARMTIARKLDMSKLPVFKVNGVEVLVPNNWGGYDQTGRDDFFGTIEIPFSMSLLKAGANELSFTFDDQGGRIACVILETEVYDEPLFALESKFKNAGFEQGDALCWIPSGLDGEVRVEKTSTTEGNYAAILDGVCGLGQVLELEPQANYRLRGDVAVDGGILQIVVDELTKKELSSSTMQGFDFEFTTGKKTQVYIGFEIKQDGISAKLDNIVIDKVI